MEYLTDVRLVVAMDDAAGRPRFVDDVKTLETFHPGKVESHRLWRFEGDSSVIPREVGGVPKTGGFAGPGGAVFTVVCFPPRAEHWTLEEMRQSNPSLHVEVPEDPEMHSTETIDLGLVVSGRMDLRLSTGEVRTLSARTAFVVGGATHAWANPYDEPCIFSIVAVGVPRQPA